MTKFCTATPAITPRGSAQVSRGKGRGSQPTHQRCLRGKVSVLRTESYITERAARANLPKALGILKRAGHPRTSAAWHADRSMPNTAATLRARERARRST